MQTKHLTILDSGQTSPSGKTKIFEVRSKHSPLGIIAWYPHWRQYTFQPEGATIFNTTCLMELSQIVRKLSMDHKKEKKAKE